MSKPFDYGYDFDFPRGYHPGNASDCEDYYFDEKILITMLRLSSLAYSMLRAH